jgi:YfiH family protein
MPSETLFAENLHALNGVRHAFFTKNWGNGGFSGQKTGEDALSVRASMAQQLNILPQHLLFCHQIHSNAVVTVSAVWPAKNNPQADAMVTSQKGVALGILTADCVPVLFADDKNGVIGAAHAGWRGAVSGILENTLQAMELSGAQRSSIHAALGPCIWQKSYEVGPEFPAPFLAENPGHERFFRASFKSGHYLFDLPGYVIEKMKQSGVQSIEPSPADTCAYPERFFSHRYSTLHGENREGNLVSAIVREE